MKKETEDKLLSIVARVLMIIIIIVVVRIISDLTDTDYSSNMIAVLLWNVVSLSLNKKNNDACCE